MADDDDKIAERKKRWRMALGSTETDTEPDLSPKEKAISDLLDKLYKSDRQGGLSPSRPVSAKWLGQIKSIFPKQVVRIVQKDAIDRFGIKKLLSQPAFLQEVEPDVNLVATILTVKEALPAASIEVARSLIRRLAKSIEDQLRFKLLDRLTGQIDRKTKIKNPSLQQIDWDLTIRHNLKNYQPSLRTIIPEVLLGRPRKHNALKRVVLLVDQSASMAESFVYAGILGSIIATIKSLETHLIIFDTEVVDLTPHINDPVDLLLHGQLGGGTNIQKALAFANNLLDEGPETYIILISDLYEGAPKELLLPQVAQLLDRSFHLIALLALDDHGTPAYDHETAKQFSQIGVPCFGCTPDRFPDVMGAALNHEDLSRFAVTG